jgi:hypothetical protein
MANVYDLLKQGTAGTPGLNNTDTDTIIKFIAQVKY